MELEGPRSEHHLSGAKGAMHSADRYTRTTVNQTSETQLAFAHRRPGCSAYQKFLYVCQPTNDVRAATSQVGAGQIRFSNQIRVDPFGCQSVLRQAVTALLPRRLADPQAGAAFRAGWNESPRRFIPFSTPRRAPTLPPTAHVQKTRRTLGLHGSPSIVPTSGPDMGSSPEVARNPGTGDFSHPQLALTAVAFAALGLSKREEVLEALAKEVWTAHRGINLHRRLMLLECSIRWRILMSYSKRAHHVCAL